MWVEFEAAKARQKQQIQRDLVLAWHIEALQRQKKLPALEDLLRTRRRQTVGEQRAMLQMLGDQLGIPLRKRKVKGKVRSK